MTNMNFGWRTKLLAIAGSFIILLGLVWQMVKAINSYFDAHYFQFNKVLTIIFKPPFEVKTREPLVKEVVLDYPDEIDTPIEKYICDKFGPYDCKTALAVAKAESGLREDAVGINNGSVDIGIFQINSVHFDRCPLKQLVDAQGNVDCAYEIFKEQGWSPWVAYKNGSYLVKL